MRRRGLGIFAGLALGLAGCAGSGFESLSIRNPFRSEPKFDPATVPPATTRMATRVVTVGNEVLAANGDAIHFKPVFFTSGIQEPQVFHVQKSGMVVLSEGLVQKCSTDQELAAVICYELGKMAAERANRGPANGGYLPPAPPPQTDIVGNGRSPDQTRQAEEAIYSRRNGSAPRGAREPQADPRVLCRVF